MATLARAESGAFVRLVTISSSLMNEAAATFHNSIAATKNFSAIIIRWPEGGGGVPSGYSDTQNLRYPMIRLCDISVDVMLARGAIVRLLPKSIFYVTLALLFQLLFSVSF